MSRDEILDAVRELAEKSEASGEKAAAGVLFCLAGSLACGADKSMAAHLVDYNRQMIQQLNAIKHN